MYASGVVLSQSIRPDTNAAQVIAQRVHAAQGGDRAAFGLLYEQYARIVHGVLLAHVSWSEAEDLMQDVFVSALERIGSLRDANAFGGWLCMIARNTAADHHRRKQGIALLADHADQRSGTSVEALAVLEQIRRLPEAYRETLILRLVEGMTGPEIAERTGLTPDSVRVNLCRGMKMLREALEIKNV